MDLDSLHTHALYHTPLSENWHTEDMVQWPAQLIARMDLHVWTGLLRRNSTVVARED
jgi:hypothetical protein